MELKFNNSSKYFRVIFVSHHIFAEYSGGSFNVFHVFVLVKGDSYSEIGVCQNRSTVLGPMSRPYVIIQPFNCQNRICLNMTTETA